jgi:eukaryotic-like serine/threonine-protein kinase
MSQRGIGETRPDLGGESRPASRRRDLRTDAFLQDNPVPARQGTLPGRERRAPGSPPIAWQTWLTRADIDVDNDPNQRPPARNAATRSEPPRSGDAASRIRKANVRAALFKKPEPVRIGRFILLERLGAGAMGEVYAAYDEQLDRKVALKLVRSTVKDSERADERLLREAQTLAQVSHPNVVQVYEAGTHDGGVFIAMEFIRGKTLAAWLEGAEKLPRPERQREILRQLIAAGRGLEAAHGAGLAHRDFKPDNVLVGDDGRVRVVDFGLARVVADTTTASGGHPAVGTAPAQAPDGKSALQDVPVVTGEHTWDMEPPAAPSGDRSAVPDRELLSLDSTEAATPAPELITPAASPSSPSKPGQPSDPGAQRKAALRLTATGMVMGTPRYMAPEQMRGQTPDHRSDQFSFCVALFHALYGEWPFKGGNALELMRAAAAGKLVQPKSQAEVPAVVRKAILRGLSAAPAERFANMGELLRVLEARLQRGRRGVWVIAAAALVTGGAVAFAAVGRAPEPCAEVTSEIDALWSPARKQALGSAFHASGQVYADIAWRSTERAIDEYVTAWRSGARDACEAAHVHQRQSPELFDRRMLCLDRGRQRLDALLASMDGDTAPLDAKLVERAFDAASALPDLTVCSDADAMSQALEPPAGPKLREDVAEVRRRLADAYTSVLLGRSDEALDIAQEQRQVARSLPYPPVHAEALFHAGSALAARGTSQDASSAEAILLDAVDIAESVRHDELVIEIWHQLVLLALEYHPSNEYGHAWLRREQAAVGRIDAPARTRTRVLYDRGRLSSKEGNDAEAIEHKRQAIALLEEAEPQSALLVNYYHTLASSEYQRGNYTAARELYDRAMERAIQTRGLKSPNVARLQRDLAMTLIEIDELGQARTMLEDALAFWEQTQGDERFQVAMLHLTLAEVEANGGNIPQAREHAQTARTILARVLQPDHSIHADAYKTQGIIELRQGDAVAAREAFEMALTIRRRHLGSADQLVGWILYYLSESLIGLERYESALTHCDQAEKIIAADTSMPALHRALLLGVRGRALLGRGDGEQAVETLEQAVAAFREHPGSLLERAATLWALARALDAGNPDAGSRAIELATEARDIYATRAQAGARVRDDIDAWLRERNQR